MIRIPTTTRGNENAPFDLYRKERIKQKESKEGKKNLSENLFFFSTAAVGGASPLSRSATKRAGKWKGPSDGRSAFVGKSSRAAAAEGASAGWLADRQRAVAAAPPKGESEAPIER